MKDLSYITEGFTESVIREMTRVCDRLGGINLAQGFPDFPPSVDLEYAALEAIRNHRHQYPVTYGEPELREAISTKARTFNGLDYDPEEEITVTCGATEAMLSSLLAMVNRGDEVVIFEPFYENYGPGTMLAGAVPRFVSLYPPDWRYDEDELARAFNDRTKAIVINTPNNPTGKVFDREELEAIAALCRKWDCYAITDEIYEHIVYDGAEHVSIAGLDGMRDRTVTINSVSKTYAVTGWRVGWAIAAAPITKEIRKVHDFATVGAPTPLQHASAHALSRFPPEYYAGMLDAYAKRRDLLMEVLQECGFAASAPAGAYYVIAGTDGIAWEPRAPKQDFSLWLLDKAGVATVPGRAFYSTPGKGENEVRFCFSKLLETLEGTRARLRSTFS